MYRIYSGSQKYSYRPHLIANCNKQNNVINENTDEIVIVIVEDRF